MNSLTEVKKFDKLKKGKKHAQGTVLEDKHRQRCLQSRCPDTVVPAIPQDNAKHMERQAQSAAKLATSEWSVEAGEPKP